MQGLTKLLIKKIKCQVVFVETIVSGSNAQQTKHPNKQHCHCYKFVGLQERNQCFPVNLLITNNTLQGLLLGGFT